MSAPDAANACVLNVGAGPTPPTERRLRGRVRYIVGVDPDPIVLTNQDLDEARVFDGIHLPFDRATFDVVISDWTVEHVRDPLSLMSEIHRVLRPGASFWFRTSNLFHYSYLVAKSTPTWFHKLVANRARRLPLTSHVPWPTFYRMNTVWTVRHKLRSAGFDKVTAIIEIPQG